MKNLLIVLQLFIVVGVYAQTADTLYYERFETGGSTFSLNTADEGGVNAATGYNQWVINAEYTGGNGQLVCAGFPTTFTIPNTQLQPAGVTGGPSTFYMHIYSDAAQSSGILNNSFLAANGLCGNDESYFSAMNQDISTVGYSTVDFSFLWLCGGGNNSYGEVYYSTNSGVSWNLVTTTPAHFNNQGTWVPQLVSIPVFAGQNTLRFGFRFVNNNTFNASDPAFGIDEVLVTAENAVAPVVAAFASSDSSFCEGNCINFTDVSSGNPDTWLWIFQGSTTAFSTQQNPGNICYTIPGIYPVTLIAGNASGTDTITANTITVFASPAAPVITALGDTLIATPGFASYTWFRDSVVIAGADSNSYISVQSGNYFVIVSDTNGCTATSLPVLLNTGIAENNSVQFEILPNPTTGIFFIRSSERIASIKIVNVLGGTVWNKNEGSNSAQIDISNLSQGSYFIKVTGENGNETTRKLILTK